MKKSLLFFVSMIFASGLFLNIAVNAQAPQKMSYQAVVRNTADELVKSSNIGMQISILQGSPAGGAVFVERHFPTTNANGLVTLEIGNGLLISGDFTTINWAGGPYYIKVETDLNGGASYTISGTSQILSVPYALFSESAGEAVENDPVWAVASGDYYTKVSLQTGGQATVNWNNISNIDPDITDLADGTLSGYKVGAGISAANLTGIVTLANGGTDASDAPQARINLGLGALAILNLVGPDQIIDGSVASADVQDNSLTAIDISVDAIGSDEIAANAVGSQEIADNAVGSSEIADNAVGPSEIAPDAVGFSEIAADAVSTLEIADNSITFLKMADNAIGNAELQDNAVMTTEIAANTILAIDIATGAVGADEIAADAVGSSEIANNSIMTADVNSIDASKISGISNINVPRSNGTGLQNGTVYDNGSTVGIGQITTDKKLLVSSNTSGIPYGIYAYSIGGNADNYGIRSTCYNGTSTNYGVAGDASSSSTGPSYAYGVYGGAGGTGTNYGIMGLANGATLTTNYGVYGSASNGATNWAAYFGMGNVHINEQLRAPNLASGTGTDLILDASGWIRRLSSDSRLKENIIPLENSLQKVLKLQGVQFTWKSDNEHLPDIGFIAQDVQKVMPEMIVVDKNDGLLSVKYQNMVAVLTEAIKEQQQQIESQKEKIAQMEKLVEQLIGAKKD